jgi:hypothetical protein
MPGAGILDHSDRLLAAIAVVIGERDFRPFASKYDCRGTANSGTPTSD